MVWKPDYVTTPELKSYLEIDSADDDAFIALWITASSRNVDTHCSGPALRQFGNAAGIVTREYSAPTWDRKIGAYVYTIDDLYATDGLVVLDADGTAVTDYTLEPVNALADGMVYERLVTSTTCGKLSISTQRWGWSAVPSSVKVGLHLFAARLSARRGSPFGVAGSPSDGSEIRLLAKLDPDMITVLKPFRRKWWAV